VLRTELLVVRLALLDGFLDSAVRSYSIESMRSRSVPGDIATMGGAPTELLELRGFSMTVRPMPRSGRLSHVS
jgi:hypothetical protein